MACSSVQTYANHQDACNAFITQSTQKIGLYQDTNGIESHYTVIANDTAKDNIGTAPMEIGGGLAYGYRAYRQKAVDFRLPTMGICDKASNHITPNSYSLNLTWKMPWFK